MSNEAGTCLGIVGFDVTPRYFSVSQVKAISSTSASLVAYNIAMSAATATADIWALFIG